MRGKLALIIVTASAAPVILPWSPCPALGGSPGRLAHAQLLCHPAAAILFLLVQSACDLNAAKVVPVLAPQFPHLSDTVQRDVASPALVQPAGLALQLPRSVLALARPPNALQQAVLLAVLQLLPRLVPGHQPSPAKVDLQHIVSWSLTCSPGLAPDSCPGSPHLRISCHQKIFGAPASPHQVVDRHRLAVLQLLPVQVVLPLPAPEARCTSRPPVPAELDQPNQVAHLHRVQLPHAAAQVPPLLALPAAQPRLPLLPAAVLQRLPSTPA